MSTNCGSTRGGGKPGRKAERSPTPNSASDSGAEHPREGEQRADAGQEQRNELVLGHARSVTLMELGQARHPVYLYTASAEPSGPARSSSSALIEPLVRPSLAAQAAFFRM